MSEPYEVPDERLLWRAVRNSRGRKGQVRWSVVMDLFAVGSTYARLICRRLGFDPDEVVRR